MRYSQEFIAVFSDSDDAVLLSSVMSGYRAARMPLLYGGPMFVSWSVLFNGNGLFDDANDAVTLLVDGEFIGISGGPFEPIPSEFCVSLASATSTVQPGVTG